MEQVIKNNAIIDWIDKISSSRAKRLSKEFLWIGFGQVIAVIGSIAGVRILTEMMSPNAYGQLALVMTVTTLVSQTIFGPLVSGAIRFYAPASQNDELKSYLKAVRQIVLISTIIVIIIFITALLFLVIIKAYAWLSILAMAIVFSILSGYNSIFNGIQNAARQRAIVTLHQGLLAWGRVLFAAIFILLIGATGTAALTGYSISLIIILGSQYSFFRKVIKDRHDNVFNYQKWNKQILRYSWPIAITGIFSWGFFASQRWALELFASTEDVGYFSAVFQIGFSPVMLAGGIILTLMMPIVFGRAGDGLDKQKVNLVVKWIIKFCSAALMMVLLFAAFGAVFHKFIFDLMVAEEYRIYSYYLPYTMLAGGLFQISLFLSTGILVDAKTTRLLPINIIGNLLVAGLNFLFTYLYGIKGLFIAMVLGSAIHLAWNIYNTYKVLIAGRTVKLNTINI